MPWPPHPLREARRSRRRVAIPPCEGRMFQRQIDLLPPESRGVVTALLTPLRWIPEWMSGMLTFFTGQSAGTVVLMTVALALPAGLLVAGMWSTMLSLYTIPFRSNRGAYMTSMLMAWWDGAR